MPPIRETIARAIDPDAFIPDSDWYAHVRRLDMGQDIPRMASKETVLAEHSAARDDARSAADAVLRALDEAGCVVVPTDPASEARRGLEWFERTFGVPLGDMPGREDVERVRAMISASVVE